MPVDDPEFPALNPPVAEYAELDTEKTAALIAEEWGKIRWYGRPVPLTEIDLVSTVEN